jgi:hypothetical protein
MRDDAGEALRRRMQRGRLNPGAPGMCCVRCGIAFAEEAYVLTPVDAELRTGGVVQVPARVLCRPCWDDLPMHRRQKYYFEWAQDRHRDEGNRRMYRRYFVARALEAHIAAEGRVCRCLCSCLIRW